MDTKQSFLTCDEIRDHYRERLLIQKMMSLSSDELGDIVRNLLQPWPPAWLGWSLQPGSPLVEKTLPRVGICTGHPARPHLYIEWKGCYTICSICYAHLRYETVDYIRRYHKRTPPDWWPDKMIGYKP